MSEACKKREEWLQKLEEGELKEALRRMTPQETEDAFFADLRFGTGGLRGVMGPGTRAMNVVNIRRAAAGVADWIGIKKAVVCYDSREHSAEFARAAAEVLAARGIRVLMGRELLPTPFLSFAVRAEGAGAGVMITASHNPAPYNGFKVYGPDGCQITEGDAAAIAAAMEGEDGFSLPRQPLDEAERAGLFELIPEALEQAYLDDIAAQAYENFAGLKVLYTPLNGAGWRLVPALLRRFGANVTLCKAQSLPDGRFPTCPRPNPELDETMRPAVEAGEEVGADLVLATDPDADRVGVFARKKGRLTRLSGAEVGALLAEFLLRSRQEAGTLTARPVLIKTIVTGDLVRPIAAPFGGEVREVLTGFKYIGESVAALEREGRAADFVLGFEESCGYLSGLNVRDKDGVLACFLICQAAARAAREGTTLAERLDELYERHGCFEQRLFSFDFPGAEGEKDRIRVMERLRKDPPADLCGAPVRSAEDFAGGLYGLPPADVLRFRTEELTLTFRPSGTEPLVKVYAFARGNRAQNAALFDRCQKELAALVRP